MAPLSEPHRPSLPLAVAVLALAWQCLDTPTTRGQNPDPITDPFVVQLTGDELLSEVAVGASDQGHFVAVWRAYSSSPVRSRMRAQRLDLDGTWMGPEFLVAFEPSNTEMAPDIGLSAAGDFIIVWDQGTDIKAQRYHVSGSPVGPELQVNTYSTGDQLDSDVAVHPSGSFVVTWSSNSTDGQILAQRFDSNGQFLGEPITVVSDSEGERRQSRLAMGDAGDFVVVWRHRDPVGLEPSRIEGRRYGSDGQPQEDTFQVSTPGLEAADRPAVARHADGRFVVAWSEELTSESGQDVLIRRFDSSGLPLGDAFRVNTETAGDQVQPRLDLDDAGGFQVVWLSEDGNGASYSVRGRSFSVGGHPRGDEWPVSQQGAALDATPDIALSDSGEFMVTWADGGMFNDILGRSFRSAMFFADGFESGDTSAWSTSSP